MGYIGSTIFINIWNLILSWIRKHLEQLMSLGMREKEFALFEEAVVSDVTTWLANQWLTGSLV